MPNTNFRLKIESIGREISKLANHLCSALDIPCP